MIADETKLMPAKKIREHFATVTAPLCQGVYWLCGAVDDAFGGAYNNRIWMDSKVTKQLG